jgi:hypothetical protein
MPVFSALMTSAFGAMDPFSELVRLDRFDGDENVHILPDWVADALVKEPNVSRIAR